LVADRFPWATWTAGPRRGPAANRNHGARLARAEWLAFTDDDCLPDPGWLAGFARALASESVSPPDVLEGRTYADRPRRSLAERSPINTHGGYLWSCNFAVRASVFVSLGGFNEGFPYAAMEDVDFARRLRAAGAREQFVEAAGVRHPWREIPGFRAMWTVEERYCASLRHFLTLHPEAWSEYTLAAGLKTNLRILLRETLPGIFRWQGRGLGAALAWHLHQLKRLGFLFHSRPKPPVPANPRPAR
ncbi:MAG: glycosyltransferase, partial [Opitutales bacterium]|jgi:GT2 family glycosyltransferase